MQSTYELVIDEGAGMITLVPLCQLEVSIGRQLGNAILLTERNVSRHHARLVRAGNAIGIEDLGSYTGVLVNGQRIAGRAAIGEGDRVQIGDYCLALRRVAVAQRRRASDLPAATGVLTPAPVQPHLTVKESSARGLVPQRKDLTGISWRALVIAAVVTIALLCGVASNRQPAAPGVPAANPSRSARGAVRPPEAVRPASVAVRPPEAVRPAADPAAPSRARTTARDPGPLVSPPAAVTRRWRQIERQRQGQTAPAAVAGRPAGTAEPTAEQATELLEKAQRHYINGEFAEAIQVARRLRTSQGAALTRAWRIQGAAACKLADFDLINEAYHRVDPVSRQYML